MIGTVSVASPDAMVGSEALFSLLAVINDPESYRLKLAALNNASAEAQKVLQQVKEIQAANIAEEAEIVAALDRLAAGEKALAQKQEQLANDRLTFDEQSKSDNQKRMLADDRLTAREADLANREMALSSSAAGLAQKTAGLTARSQELDKREKALADKAADIESAKAATDAMAEEYRAKLAALKSLVS